MTRLPSIEKTAGGRDRVDAGGGQRAVFFWNTVTIVYEPAVVISMGRVIAAALLLCASCGRTRTAAGPDVAVARIDDHVITLGDFEKRLAELSPLARARNQSPADRRKLLGTLVDRELMAQEARRRGYDRRPEIQKMLNDYITAALLRDEVDARLKPEDVPDADVETYYRDHEAEFSRPEEVRASAIVVRDKAKADKVAAEARKSDDRAFRLLVARHSEDAESKARGGDLGGFFDRRTTRYPRPVVDAALALQKVGDFSSPVQTERGYYILRLEQKRPGFSRPLGEAKDQLRRQLLSEVRVRRIAELVARSRADHKVEVFEDRLPVPAR
jgi:peptidyl-prolyl cis-trans isomerase C